jgi:GAF domain-containing protein
MINDQAYIDRDPARVRLVEAGYRSQLSVPLIKDNEAIGAFNICRKQPGIFTEKQIELVKNFAAQAVIAIENTRLLSELRQRTQEVSKLNQQLEQRVADQVGEIERSNRRVGIGKAARKPSPGDYRALLRSARVYRLQRKLGPRRCYVAAG